MNLLSNRALLLVAAAAAVVCGLLARDGGFVDLAVYRFGGAAVLDDGRLYVEGTPGTGLPFTYPPFAALVMAPVAAVPFPLAVAGWTFATVLALGWVVARFLRETAYADRPWLVAAVTALALGFEPVWANLAFGQVNVFLMALLVADLLGGDRRRAGVLIGIAAGLKLTPLLFVVLLLLVRRPRTAANACLSFLGTIAAGFALAPEASGAYWTGLLWDAGRVGGVPYAGNQSMLAVLFRVLGHEPSTLLWFVVAGATAFGVLLAAALVWHRGRPDAAVCLAAVAMLVASPISWSHHWVWAVPLTVVLAGCGRSLVARTLVAGAWVAVFCSACIWWPPHRDNTELAWTPAEHLVGNAYLLAALVVTAYVALAVAHPRAVRTTRAHAQASPV